MSLIRVHNQVPTKLNNLLTAPQDEPTLKKLPSQIAKIVSHLPKTSVVRVVKASNLTALPSSPMSCRIRGGPNSYLKTLPAHSRNSNLEKNHFASKITGNSICNSMERPTESEHYTQRQLQSSQFVVMISPDTKRLQMIHVPAESILQHESINLSNLASPLYNKAARFLKKDWIVKKKQLDAICKDQLKTRDFCGEPLPSSQVWKGNRLLHPDFENLFFNTSPR